MSHDSEVPPAEERLDAELAQLRERLRGVHAPQIEATALPAALGARHARRTPAPLAAEAASSPRPRGRVVPAVARRPRAVVAVAAAMAMAAVAALLALRVAPPLAERGVGPQAGSSAAAPPAEAARGSDTATALGSSAAAFQPLLYAPGFSPTGSYSVVRVRIPLSALAQGPRLEGTIEADLLVGEDGLASGIRFASTDTQVVFAGPR
jgi:hypothetical protein